MVYPSDINLNLNTRYVLPIPTAQQGDTARVLTFNILDKGVPFNLTGKTVRAKILKPDNTKCYNDLTITNATGGECNLKLTNQVLAVAGKVNCQLEIKEGEELLSTIIFSIDVEPSIDITGAVESSNEFTALLNGIIKLDEWDKYFKETSAAIEEKYTERLNGIDASLEEKVNKEQGKGLSTNDYTTDEKNKLSNIEERANAYVHPLNHSATIITQDSTHRFITDIERDRWNNTFNHGSSNCEVLTTKEGTKIGFQHGYITTDGSEYWKTVTFPNAFKDIYYSAFVSPFYKTAFGSVSASDFTSLNMKVCAESGVMYVYWLAIGELAE